MPPHTGAARKPVDPSAGDVPDTHRSTRLPPSLNSPIFWRIAAVVFLCIVLIEAVLLFFSWFSERDRLLMRIDDSLALIAPLLADADRISELDRLLDGRLSDHQYPLLGYVLLVDDYTAHANGNTLNLERNDPPTSTFDADKNYYDSYVVIPATEESAAAGLWLRVDANSVSDRLRAYVFSIIGLVLIISVFVTVGCLLALTPILIRPLQTLNRLMLIGQRRGLRHVVIPPKALKRADELGYVYQSFERLRAELVAAAEENDQITRRFQHFADLGADSFWEVDHRLRFTHAAGDIKGMFGLESDKLLGQPIQQCLSRLPVTLSDRDQAWPALKAHGFWEGSLYKTRTSGTERTIRVIARGLHDDKGAFAGVRGTVVDITEASDLARELKYQASHDALTGLYNRREFDRILAHELSAFNEKGTPLIVCMLDLDRFKIVNDNCGHAAGDLLLKQLSELIRTSVRENDVVARFGGDEFTLLLRGCRMEHGLRVANTLRQSIDEYRFTWEKEIFNVGASIGIAEASDTLADAESLILAADACCIKAKNLGRNQVQAYNPGDEAVAKQHSEMQWMARISQALEEDRLVLFQQPIVALDPMAAEEIHMEILLRMKDRSGNIYSPGEFLPAAERYGLIEKIDRCVVDQVVSWLGQQSIDPDITLCININLSAVTASDTSFQSFLSQKISDSKVNAGHLCFEITESAAMNDPAATVNFLHSLRALGCQIALDDFGTGFSSLGHIQKLPIDYIKIDGVFIQNLADNQLDQALVRSVAEVAKILKVKTVAEFVEDEQTLAALRLLDIDYGQGYFFAKPEPLGPLNGLTGKRFAA